MTVLLPPVATGAGTAASRAGRRAPGARRRCFRRRRRGGARADGHRPRHGSRPDGHAARPRRRRGFARTNATVSGGRAADGALTFAVRFVNLPRRTQAALDAANQARTPWDPTPDDVARSPRTSRRSRRGSAASKWKPSSTAPTVSTKHSAPTRRPAGRVGSSSRLRRRILLNAGLRGQQHPPAWRRWTGVGRAPTRRRRRGRAVSGADHLQGLVPGLLA